MSESLKEIMGAEYAQSFEGDLYKAYEAIMQETSSGKFKLLGKEILSLAPSEMRDRIGYETVAVSGQLVARWAKEEAWLQIPELPTAQLTKITTTIMWIAPKRGKELIRLWHEQPKRVIWNSLDVFKLLAACYGIEGWH